MSRGAPSASSERKILVISAVLLGFVLAVAAEVLAGCVAFLLSVKEGLEPKRRFRPEMLTLGSQEFTEN